MLETGTSSARPRLLIGMKEARKSAQRQRVAWHTSLGTAALTGSDYNWGDLTR